MKNNAAFELYIKTSEMLKNKDDTSVPIEELLTRVKTARSALDALKKKDKIIEVPSSTHEDMDKELWKQTQGKLKPTRAETPELGNWYGNTMYQVITAIINELQTIARMDIETQEKVDLYPIPLHTNKVLGDEILDLTTSKVTQNDTKLKRLILPQLQASQGKFWTCGGVLGALVSASQIDTKSMFFQTEYAIYKSRFGQYPKDAALKSCQQRVKTKIESISKFQEDQSNIFGLQIVLTTDGQLDWIPVVRKGNN